MTRPYLNGLTRFTTPRFTLSDITPVTYRDGESYASLLWRLFRHITEVLNPSIETSFRELIAQLETEMAKAEQQYVDGVQEFQRIHDAFMSDVNAHLIALNDAAMSDLVQDDTSMLGETLRSIFPDNDTFDAFRQNINTQHTELLEDIDRFKVESGEAFDQFKDESGEAFDQFTQRTDTVLQRFDDQVAEIHRILGRQLDPILSGVLDTKAVVVLVGSSTTTRDEFPKEFARHVHNQYQPGAFRTLRRSEFGPVNNELKDFPLPEGVHVINAGWGGSTGADYVDGVMAQEISALNPTLMIHSIGANDWYHDRNPRNLVTQISRVIDMVHSDVPLWHVLLHQHERTNTSMSNRYQWDDYLESLYDVADMYDNVIVVNAAEPMRELGVGRGLDDRFNLMDGGSHLSEDGHRIFARIVADKIGFLAPGGVNDTGWLKVTRDSKHVKLQPQGTSSDNENLVYRVVGDAGGFTTYIRGINSRDLVAGDRADFMEITPEWRNLLIPKTWFNPQDRHRIGTWHTTRGDIEAGSGPVYMRSSGAIHALNVQGSMGPAGFFVDCVIRS